jgi:hypothetical protein
VNTLRPLAALALALLGAGPAGAAEPVSYRGLCDASAAAALDARHFVVAGDEDNRLRIYRRGEPEPLREVVLDRFLGTRQGAESDLEGAARVGNRIYWIASLSRNSKGKARPDRQRFFVTEVEPGDPPGVRPVGRPQERLLADLIAAPGLQAWRLGEAAQRAPEAPGGLNVEGLAEGPDGTLLIGLRNPLREGRALLVPLLNPDELLRGEAARFGEPIALDLGGRGVRSIDRIADAYLIVAGPVADAGDFALFRWSGRAAEAPQRVPGIDLKTLRPEALFAWPGSGTWQLLSDDGGIETAGVACKDRPPRDQAFRSVEWAR